MADDMISRQVAIDVLGKIFLADPMRNDYTKGITCGAALATAYIKQLPSAQPNLQPAPKSEQVDCISRQAGIEGREIEFRIGGRLFAIREKAQ